MAGVARARMDRDASSVFGRGALSSSSDRFVASQEACDAAEATHVTPSSSLAEQLRVRRAEAEAEEQRRVQAMQQGAVRPLDVDEAAFLATCDDARRRLRLDALRQERRALATYRAVRGRTAVASVASLRTSSPSSSSSRTRRRFLSPSVRVHPRHATSIVAYPSSEDEPPSPPPPPPPHVEEQQQQDDVEQEEEDVEEEEEDQHTCKKTKTT